MIIEKINIYYLVEYGNKKRAKLPKKTNGTKIFHIKKLYSEK